MGEVPVRELMWFILMDSMLHRGQFSTYLGPGYRGDV